jgi:hypothetical protein
MAITNTQLTTTGPTTVFQAVGQQAITVMYICNTSASAVSCNVYVLDSTVSNTVSNTNMVYNQLELTAGGAGTGDTYVIDNEKIILDNNDSIKIEANIANSISVTVSSIAV